MSEEYTFEELCHFNWNDSLSLKSQKNMNFTMSDISKNDLEYKIFPEQNQEQWNVDEFNKKNAKKLKNKTNVKNYRERQKIQQTKNQKKIKLLQEQNQRLKAEKYCKHCNKRFVEYIKISSTQNQIQQHPKNQNKYDAFGKQRVQNFEFQKPNFFPHKQQKKNNGKIWIALGILMLVIGIHLYGFNGKDGYKGISISKIQSQKWISVYQDKQSNMDQYFNVKLKTKQKNPKQIQKHKHLFKQINIFHQQQQYQVQNKQYEKTTRETIQKLQMIQQGNTKENNQIGIQSNKQQSISFHKQLLFAIQAEIDDMGNYM